MKKYIFKSLFVGILCFLGSNIFSQTLTLVSDNATLNQSVCVNTPIIEIKYDVSTDITSVSVEGLPNGVTHDFNITSHILTINGTPTDIVNTTFTITTTGGVNSISAYGTINVEQLNLPSTIDGFKCSNENITFEYQSNPAYIWSHNGNGNFVYNYSGSNPQYIPSKNDEGTNVKITVKLTNSCGTDSKDFNYSILKTPSFTGNLTTNPSATVQLIGSETTGFNWTSSIVDTATISSTGLVTGVGIGKTTITYELTHLDNAGATITTCQYSQILSVVQLITPTISGNNIICKGTTTQLTGSENAAINNPWLSSNTNVATVSSTGEVSAIGSGTTTITYTNSTNGNTTFALTVNGPNVNAGPDQSICLGNSVVLNATGANSYSWNNSVVNGISFIPTLGTKTYTVTATENNCTATADVEVIVNLKPELVITNPTAVCSPSTVDITDIAVTSGSTSGGILSYWTESQCINILNNPNAIINSGPIFIKTTLGNCFDVKPVMVDIKPSPNITNPGNQIICDLYSLPIISGTNLSGNVKYYDNSKANNGIQLLGPISKNQILWIYDDNNGCNYETSFEVTINKTPSITNPGNQTICDSLELPNISGVNLSGNQKYFDNSKANNGVQITKPINSNKTVWIYDESGSCSDEKSFEIKIIKTPKLTSPGNQIVCDSYNLPTISGINLTGNEKYYDKSQAEHGIQITGPIKSSQNVWMYDSIKACANEIGFEVTINTTPVLKITNPDKVDYPTKINITLAGVTEGSTGNGTLSYWINTESSIELINPSEISMSGTYFIKSTVGNCSDTNFVTVTINKKDIPTKLLSAYVVPTGVSNNGLCDGKAEVVITAGAAPYTYLFSDNLTTSSALNLCSGLKSVRVADANKDTLNLEFIIPSPENVKSTDNLKDSTVVDKLFNKVVSNCIIDYTKIDYAKINKYKILSKDSVEIEWQIYSGLTVISITNKYSIHVISTSGVYQFTLQIYCPNKMMGNFLTAYDQLYINVDEINNTSGLGIQEKSTNEYLIYPNPFNDYLTITLGNQKSSEISITDNTGKIMKSYTTNESEVTIKTDNLLPGFYILKIKNGSSIKSIKLLK